ncbi:hypothetical protein AAYQ05_00945 [Flavobacterium sp. B11]|uniref:hypothetical protein n=1 Tax=Flavobacterium movens TaxID=214860 RepID=UPI0031E093E1
MAQAEVKRQAFEYLLYKLVEWYKSAYAISNDDNDISVLKALKLLFFVSAVNATKDSNDTLLDDVFQNFVAMPYGHVESEVYSIIKKGDLQNIIINNYRTEIRDFDPETVDAKLRQRIDDSVTKLKNTNFNLIKYSSFNLVDLSHSWYSWQYFYNKALKSFNKSFPIDKECIKSEEKIYSL